MQRTLLPIAAAVAIIAVGAVVQGIWTERWAPRITAELKEFDRRLPEVPMVIGDWTGETTEVDERQLKASRCTGHISRVYRDSRGRQVSVFLVSGTARNITWHTPDWCYRAAGFEMVESTPRPFTIDCGEEMAAQPQYLTSIFERTEEGRGTQRLRIFWTYTDDGAWTAPQWPKEAFAGRLALLKLYLITIAPADDDPPDNSPAIDFAKAAMPVITETIFAPRPEDDQSVADETAVSAR